MTRFDAEASEVLEHAAPSGGPRLVSFEARDVPLGGVRAMEVRRLLPQRTLPMVGAWCFLDRFGPQSTRMRVEPHPHIGLQTVTWPLVGEVHHRDTVGSDVIVRRGSLDLMTSGAGIAHSEYSVGEGEVPLDALQLWVALPDGRRHGAPAFEQHTDLPVIAVGHAEATIVMGELAGTRSPATVHTPIVGAEVRIPAGGTAEIPLDPRWEHALVGVLGDARVSDARVDAREQRPIAVHSMTYLGTGRTSVSVSSAEGATLFLLGGEPFGDEIVMWWNFVARSHDEIVAAREAWEADDARFGHVVGHGEERIPAPPLPGVRLRPRSRRL